MTMTLRLTPQALTAISAKRIATLMPKPALDEAAKALKAERRAAQDAAIAAKAAKAAAKAAKAAEKAREKAARMARAEAEFRMASKLRAAANTALRKQLCAAFPAAFDSVNPRPLAKGIDHAISQRLGISRNKLRTVLHNWTDQGPYLCALASGGTRVDLDGMPAGEVTAEEQAIARAALASRIARVAA